MVDGCYIFMYSYVQTPYIHTYVMYYFLKVLDLILASELTHIAVPLVCGGGGSVTSTHMSTD